MINNSNSEHSRERIANALSILAVSGFYPCRAAGSTPGGALPSIPLSFSFATKRLWFPGSSLAALWEERRRAFMVGTRAVSDRLINEDILGKCFRGRASCDDPRISPLTPQYECPRQSLLIITSGSRRPTFTASRRSKRPVISRRSTNSFPGTPSGDTSAAFRMSQRRKFSRPRLTSAEATRRRSPFLSPRGRLVPATIDRLVPQDTFGRHVCPLPRVLEIQPTRLPRESHTNTGM